MPMIPLQGILFSLSEWKEKLGSCDEIHEKKSEGEIRRLQGDEIQAHFEKGISACPVIQDEIAQRDTDNNVRRNKQA